MPQAMVVSALLLFAVFSYPGSPWPSRWSPRAYSNLPIGMNFLIAGYALGGGYALDPSLPVKDVNMRIHSAVLAYARSLDLVGKSGRIDCSFPTPGFRGPASSWKRSGAGRFPASPIRCCAFT